MYKQKCKHLSSLPTNEIEIWINSFDTVISDCDGVLWNFGQLIPGSAEVLNNLKRLGKSIYLCTNNSSKTRREIHGKAEEMGFEVAEENVISSANSTAAYLKKLNFNKRVHVVGSEGITRELDAVGITHIGLGPDLLHGTLIEYVSKHLKLEKDIGAVVVGFDQHFSFPKMLKTASYLRDPSCLFIATNTDECLPLPSRIIPGSGSIVNAIKTCAGREPTIIGKPNPEICSQLIRNKKINPQRTLMIGDRSSTDILLGHNCGFQTLLVGTGVQKLSDVENWKASSNPEHKKLIPDVYLPALGDLSATILNMLNRNN